MEFQNLGASGLKVSRLSFGSWITFGKQLDLQKATNCITKALDLGVNFFDNAEVYASGQSEEVMGSVFKKIGLSRLQYIVSTKFYWGIEDGVNSRNTLNRKYLMQAMDGSLKRLQMDYVDLVYCHRPDPNTPVEETVWTMNDMISSGKALYWGTSEWSAREIEEAFAVCTRLNLRKPIVEQPQYNLFWRERVEREYAPLYERHRLGLTTWSPLASGTLTGKYINGIPTDSRLAHSNLSWLKEDVLQPQKMQATRNFVALAGKFDCTPAQLAIAWCLGNANVSSVITGASRVEQVEENMHAFNVFKRLTDDDFKTIAALF